MTIETLLLQAMALTTAIMLALCYIEKLLKSGKR